MCIQSRTWSRRLVETPNPQTSLDSSYHRLHRCGMSILDIVSNLLRTLLLLASSSYSMNHLGSPVGVCFACSVLFLFCSRGHGGLGSVTVVMKCRMEGWRDSVGGSWLEWCEWAVVVGWWVLAEQAGQQQRFECGVWSWCGGRSVACIITVVERSGEKRFELPAPRLCMIPDRCLWACCCKCSLLLPLLLLLRCGLASSDRRNNEAPCTCTASSHIQDRIHVSQLLLWHFFFVPFPSHHSKHTCNPVPFSSVLILFVHHNFTYEHRTG